MCIFVIITNYSRMRKIKVLLFLFLIVLIHACEQDTICIDETTPHLIIRFYDKTDISAFKEVTNLKVYVENSTDVEISDIKTTDSIVIPLNVDLDYTKIRLSKNTSETSGIEDVFTLNYSRKDIFVSRSCGYKTIYDNAVTVDETSNWIENIFVDFTTIDNENQAHLKIFH